MLELEVIDPLSVWGPDVKAHLPSYDEEAISIDLENTVNDFLRKSKVFDHELEIALEEGTSNYKINPISVVWTPADTSFGGVYGIYVLYVLYDNKVVPLINYKPIRPYQSISRNTSFFSCWCPSPSELELYPTPNINNVSTPLIVRVSMTLSFPISNVPKFLADNYYDAILHGTVGRMMTHIKRPYYDKTGSALHLRTYTNELRIAKDEAIRRWSSASASFAYPRQWAARTSGFMRT